MEQRVSDGYRLKVKKTAEEISRFENIVSDRAFRLALQPIVDLGTGKVHHHECLVRFLDLKNGESPFERITFAEEFGVISALDYAVVCRAIEILKRMKAESLRGLSLAVNLSARSLESSKFVEALIGIRSIVIGSPSRLPNRLRSKTFMR